MLSTKMSILSNHIKKLEGVINWWPMAVSAAMQLHFSAAQSNPPHSKTNSQTVQKKQLALSIFPPAKNN